MMAAKIKGQLFNLILFASILFTGFMTWHLLSVSLNAAGQIIYPFDDTYIHMGVAKNLAQNGTWGINAGEFSSADSSLLYVLILALSFLIFGYHDLIPLGINLVAGILLLFLLYQTAKKYWTPFTYALVSFFCILFTPLALQISSGMEHSLQILLVTAFCIKAMEMISGREKKYDLLLLSCLALLSAMIRYESMAAIGLFSLIFLLRKKYSTSAFSFFCGLLPVLIFGWISIAKGNHFIPNSLIVKSRMPDILDHGFSEIFKGLYHNLALEARHLGLLIAFLGGIAVLLFRNKDLQRSQPFALPEFALVILGLTIFHAVFVVTGWLFRYDAYLIFLGMIAASVVPEFLKDYRKQLATAVLAGGLFLLASAGLFMRWKYSEFVMDKAPLNIWQQQVQFAEFLHTYYEGESVVIHDIGTTSWYTNCKILDVVGLGTQETIARNTKEKTEKVKAQILKRACSIGVMYNASKEELPDGWQMAGTWTIADNRICKYKTIQFWASDSEKAGLLRSNLETRMKQNDWPELGIEAKLASESANEAGLNSEIH